VSIDDVPQALPVHAAKLQELPRTLASARASGLQRQGDEVLGTYHGTDFARSGVRTWGKRHRRP
jgi:hypothetical protein